MRKGFAPLVLVIIVLVVATIGAVAYIKLKPKFTAQPVVSQSPQTTTASQPSPTPVQTDETVNWKTYTNSFYKYSIQYPENWKIEIFNQADRTEDYVRIFRGLAKDNNDLKNPIVEIYGDFAGGYGSPGCEILKKETVNIGGKQATKIKESCNPPKIEGIYMLVENKNATTYKVTLIEGLTKEAPETIERIIDSFRLTN